MKKISYLLIVFLSSCHSQQHEYEKAIQLPPQILTKLKTSAQRYVDENMLSGGVNMIAYRGKVIFEHAYGFADLENSLPMETNSLFRIASMVKPMTTACLLMLVEDGKISLDDSADKYLEAFNTMMVQQDTTLVNPAQPVTIRHLLMHVSGVRSRIDPYYQEHGINPNNASTLAAYVDTLLSAPLLFQPGTAFYYAMNHDVIARIIEVVSGQDFGEFMHDRLLKPLNMTHTWWIIPDSAMHLLANAYVFRDSLVLMDRGNAIQSTFPRGNGQMVSTPLDYMKFILMLAKKGMHGEKRILSEQSVEWMTTDMLPPAIELKVGSTVFSDTGFGLGVAISRNSLQPWEEKPLAFENLFSHLPAGCYFWPGVVNTYWWVDPENELCGLVFTQLGNPGKINNFQEFTQTFYRYFFYEK